MVYLLLSILMAVLIANLLKLFQIKSKISIYSILLFNYLFASVFSLSFERQAIFHGTYLEIILAAIMGLLYFVNFLYYNKNIKINGLSITVSISRISLIIPTIISILIFNEYISLIQGLGILIIFIAFSLLGYGNKKHNILLLLILFAGTGIAESGMKIFKEFGNSSVRVFLVYLFGFAFIANLFMVIIKKIKIHYLSIIAGLLLAIPNNLTSFFFIKSLYSIKASIAYPFYGSMIVIISIITDVFIWKSKFSLKEKLIFLLMIIGIILINLIH